MAQITLNPGESFTVSGGTNTITGRTGSGETVTVTGGNQTFDADFNAGGDRVILAGTASQYTVTRSGSTIIFSGPNGTTVSFPAPNPALTAAQQPVIQFSDASYSLSSNTTGGFNVLIGQQTITGTATTVGGGTPPPVTTNTLNVTATDVTEGQAITYTFTLATAPTAPVTINVATIGGTATAGSDFTPVSQTITFAAGQTTQFLTVNTIADGNTGEPAETVVLQVTPPAGVTLAANADLTALIAADPVIPQAFFLTTGNDTFSGGAGSDRFVGAQTTTEPGKLLSANDILAGNGGVDQLELTNAPGATPNVLADLDFTNVTSIESLVTNYANVQLGAQAAKAGIVTVDTASRTDAANIQDNDPATPGFQTQFGGTLLDLTSDANGDGNADFNNVLTVTMANSVADTIRLSLAAAAGSSFNTGTTFTPIGGAASFGQLDNVIFTAQTNPIRITITSASVGNASAFNADGTTLGVAAQSEDGNDNLTGGIVRFDDEGIRFSGNQFDVRDVSGTARGTFSEVTLGTQLNDNLFSGNAGAYINGGAGDDILTGGTGVDFLVGGAGNDTLSGGAGIDSLLGGAGNDIINGGAGIDALLDGGEGSDTYVFGDGEFVANETITDSGITPGDIDYLAITSSTALTDAQFAGRTGIEGLATNVTTGTVGGAAEVTIGTIAEGIGIRTVYASNDDVSATAYTSGLTVYGSGNVATGAGADTVFLQNQTAQQDRLTSAAVSFPTSSTNNGAYAGAVALGAGNDTLNAGYAIPSGGGNSLDGGAGTDTLLLGGTAARVVNAAYSFDGLRPGDTVNITLNNPNFVNFEAITIAATPVNAGASYNITAVDANVAAGTTFVVDGSALRGTFSVSGTNALGNAFAITNFSETLVANASALTGTRAVDVRGGGANDVLTGGAGNDILNGAAGNDTLAGGTGDDTLIGGAGNDTLTGGAGNDTLNGGDGADDYRFADTELVAGDVINDDGATGTDSITVVSATALTDALFVNKTGLEILNTNVTNGAGTEVTIGTNAQAAGLLTVNNGNDDVDASAYTIGLTVNDGYSINNGVQAFTGYGNVTTGSGNDVVNLTGQASANGLAFVLGAGDDVLNASYGLTFGAAATATLSGGAGNDTLRLQGLTRSGPNGVPAAYPNNFGDVFTFAYNFGANANFTGFERIDVLGADQAAAVAAGPDQAGNAYSANITLADQNIAAGTTFIVDATGLVASTTNLGADNEIGGTGANADTVTTPILTLNAGGVTRNLDVRGGAGDDVITTGAGADLITGGTGNDVINGGAGNDTIDAGDGDDTITGGDGFDTIRGGAGNDTIVLTVSQFNSDADNVDGGAGNDVLQINGTTAAQEVADVGFNGRFTSIEQIRLVGAGPDGVTGTGDDANTAFTYTAGFYSQSAGVNSISLGANASGSTVSVANYTTGGPLNFTTPTVTLNDIAVMTNNTTFIGSAFADTFNLGVTNTTQGGGTDAVRAGAGDDIINFGSTLTAADLVNGEAGNDTLNVSGNGTSGTVTLSVTAVGGTTPTSGIYAIETINLASGIAGTTGTTMAAPGTAGTSTSYTVTVDDTSFAATTSSLTVNGGGLRVVSTGAGADGIFGTADDTTTPEVLNYNGGGVTGTGHSQIVTGGAANDVITGGAGSDTLTGNAGNDIISGGAGVDTIDGGVGNDTLNGNDGNDVITGGTGTDTITGGLGADTINLGNDDARDTVIFGFATVGAVTTYDAPRADVVGIEQINGFGYDTDAVAGLNANADVLQFSFSQSQNGNTAGNQAGLINENSTSITNGFVQAGTVLANAINSSSSLLAAIQLVEQEFNSDPVANSGVIGFTYGGNTYVGLIEDTDPTAGITEAFTQIVQINGIQGGVNSLIDVTPGGPGHQIGLGVFV